MIEFLPVSEDFTKRTRCYTGRMGDQWNDDSFRRINEPCDDDCIGELGWPFANNAQYERNHPVCDRSGRVVGYLVGGVSNLGYTFHSVYVNHARKFYVAHQRYGVKKSQISVVAATGKKLFSDSLKFEQVETITHPDLWVAYSSVVAFKLLQNQQRLLFCGKCGYSLIDTASGRLIASQEFTKWESQVSSIAFTPNVGVAAVAFSAAFEASPLDGLPIYENYLELWDLEKGRKIGRQDLGVKGCNGWKPQFDETGRRFRIQNHDESVVHIFNLR